MSWEIEIIDDIEYARVYFHGVEVLIEEELFESYKCMAQDCDGQIFLYYDRPIFDGNIFTSDKGHSTSLGKYDFPENIALNDRILNIGK